MGLRNLEKKKTVADYPELVEQWDYDKNYPDKPQDFTYGSGKKVWWLCKEKHEWQATVNKRTNGRNCSYCSGKKASSTYNLLVNYPDVAKQWHPIKNGNLLPINVTPKSSRKVWWLCPKGADHQWPAVVGSRTGKGKRGCPYCSGNRPSIEYNLLIKHPKIAAEWHPEKNGHKLSQDFTPTSGIKVWWQCFNKHEWPARISERVNGNGCPYCSGKRPTASHNLLVKYPDVAIEWHPVKNGNLQPIDVTPGSERKVWWLCPKQHEWPATVKHRTNGRRCPDCFMQSSRPEYRILSEMRFLFTEVIHRHNFNGDHNLEIDVFIPEYNLGIEYDGSFFHKGKEKKDIQKYLKLKDKGVTLFNIRRDPLKPISNTSIIVVNDELHKNDINKMMERVIGSVPDLPLSDIESYINESEFMADSMFKTYISNVSHPSIGTSLIDKYPKVAEQWHPIKNNPLKAEYFTAKSHEKVWWLCKEKHEWEADISRRTNGAGCPFCSGRYPSSTNNLLAKYPGVAKQWHPEKNGDLQPINVTSKSSRKVWWLCPKQHEWQATVSNRTGKSSGCPYCAGNKQSTIEEMHELAESRGGKCLSTIYINTYTKLEWMCSEGHVWKAGPRDIKSGKWCGECTGNKRLTIEDMHELAESREGKCLSTIYINTGTKLEWMCSEGHVWKAVPKSIKKGKWCRKCARKEKLTIEEMQEVAESRGGRCLSTEYINNKTKLKWLCSNGHIWEASSSQVKSGTWCGDCYRLKRSRG